MAGHTARMALRTRSARFVGRDLELDRLEQALGRAGEQASTTVLVGGDAGVGKTRLIEEFARRCRRQGVRVLTGGCLELGDGGLPYGAVSEVLRELATEVGVPELRRLAGQDTGELQRLAPRVRPADPLEGEGRRIELDSSSQLRLFEALLGLVGRLAADGPLVVVFEDVHWADTSTRDLLMFLAHNLREVGVVMVATYRTDELHRQHPWRPVLARLVRGEGVERVDVAPFDREELALLLEGILGDAPGPELLERVLERSQGNAFFVEELLAAGEAQDAELPDSLRELLLITIDGLPPGVVAVLRVVAAAGGTARHGLVAQVAAAGGSEPDGGDLDGALRVAVEQRVLVADVMAGTYAFRHALLSEAVYSTLLPGEVGRLHTALATAIEADPGLAFRSAAAELAVHWEAAENQPRALSASLAAAREAEAVAGVAEARRHAERVVALWPHVPDAAERTSTDLTAVTRWAAELSYLAGDPGRAIALQERALAEADIDPSRQAVLFERLGRFCWVAGDSGGAEAAYAEAVRLMPDEPPSAERARVLSGYSQFLMISFRDDESDRHGRQALAMAREVGARAVEGHALNNLGTSRARTGDQRGLELLREARAIAEELGASDDLMRSYNNEAATLGHLARFDEAIEVGAAGLQRARVLGVERHWAASLSYGMAMSAFYAGRWQLADEFLRAAPRESGGIWAGWAHLMRAYLAAVRGEVELTRNELAAAGRLRAHVNEQSRNRFVATQLMLALLDGDTDQVYELIEGRPPTRAMAEINGLAVRAHILRALADLDVSDSYDPVLPDRVLAECHDLASEFASINALGAVWMVLAEAEHSRVVDGADRVGCWATAVARCDEFGLAYDAAYARYRLAQALLSDGARNDVADLLRSAHDVARDLGAQPLVDDLVDLARRARIDLGIQPATTAAERLGLTPREIEVLELVADGRTNPEIAERLYISAKTASVHVSNILRKLEVSTRGEAAALAHRHGPTTR
jgi:DNA-binding CsgD family transcriptional regulator